ncbi:uncharacterized protein [Antedon mediterranea]|uniref:uncharacterized protein n=1 Tax=Antedon mediterranea TaxID=105859 RepID=UPI003AF94F97
MSNRLNNHLTTNHLTSAYYQDVNIEYQQPLIENGSMPLYGHEMFPQFISYPCPIEKQVEFQQQIHSRSFPFQGNFAQPQISEANSNMEPSREFENAPYPTQISRSCFHTNYKGDTTTFPLNYEIQQSSAEYEPGGYVTDERYLGHYRDSITQGYSQVENGEKTAVHDWQFNTGVNQYYASETDGLLMCKKPPLGYGYMTLPSYTNSSYIPMNSYSNQTNIMSSFEKQKPTIMLDPNKQKIRNWLVSEESTFYVRGSLFQIEPNKTSVENSTDIPGVTSVFSIQEKYRLDAGMGQLNQNAHDLSNTLIEQEPHGVTDTDINDTLPANASCEETKIALEILHQKLIKKLQDVGSTEPDESKNEKSTEDAAFKNRSSTSLLSKRHKELKRLCWIRKLKITGSKQSLVDRLLDTTLSSLSNDHIRLKTIHAHLRRLIPSTTSCLSRCLCSAIEKGFLSLMDISLADVIAKGECPYCGTYMEATLGVVVYQPDNASKIDTVSDLLKCPSCRDNVYVTRMCRGVPVFVQAERHRHYMQRSMFGSCAVRITY